MGQAHRYGADMPVPDWRERLVCSACGSRQVDMVVTGTRRLDRSGMDLETAKVFEDREWPGDWRVEWIDDNGGIEVVIFSGPNARVRALRYADRRYGNFQARIERTITRRAVSTSIARCRSKDSLVQNTPIARGCHGRSLLS